MPSTIPNSSYANRTTLSMALNFVCAVGIIWVNKYVYSHGFRWNTTLTALHFLFTYLGLEICARAFGMSEPKKLPLKQVMPISAAFIGFVIFNNLSLQYNAVGVYQLMKVMTTPVIVAIQFFMHNVRLPFKQILALAPIIAGVVLATVAHVEVNFLGSVFGCLGIVSTSFYQIWVKTEQSRLNVSAQQLLHNQAWVSFCMLVVLAPLMEDVFCVRDDQCLLGLKWLEHSGSKRVSIDDIYLNSRNYLLVGAILISACLAFLVNLSIFLVIGKTSPVSYNVLGHAKLCCILTSGYLMFGEQTNFKNIIGVCLAVVGIVVYTDLKIRENANKDTSAGAKKKA